MRKNLGQFLPDIAAGLLLLTDSRCQLVPGVRFHGDVADIAGKRDGDCYTHAVVPRAAILFFVNCNCADFVSIRREARA